jgi:ribosomal protein S18 acetylase RimI-like enzyme
MSEWYVQQLHPALLRQHVCGLREIYFQVYREPPYYETESDADDFAGYIDGQAARPGFSLVTALSGNGETVAFAYGLPFAADQWWSNAGEEPELTYGHPKFAVFELAVLSNWRRRGIATLLMATLLKPRTEPFATLCANPAAPARAMYDMWGWRKVATTNPPKIGPMDVLVKRLGAAAEQRGGSG